MTRSDFIAELTEMLQTEETLAEDTTFADLEEWDSLAFMLLIAFFDKNFGIRLTFDEITPCKTPNDLIALSNGAIS